MTLPRSIRAARGIAIGAMALLLVSTALGFAASRDPLLAAMGVASFSLLVLLAVVGVQRFTTIVLAALPWLVLLIDVTPTLTLTLTAAFAVLLLLFMTPVRAEVRGLPCVAAGVFMLVLIGQSLIAHSSNQVIEAAKYSLFPAMMLIVSSPTNRARLQAARPLLLGSGIAAMSVDAFTVVFHFGSFNSYYGVGEQLGLAAASPHEIALIGVMVAIAILVSVRDLRWRLLGAVVAVTPALATGVRSSLLALAVSLVFLAVRARLRPSVVLSIVAICLAVVVTGVGSIISARFQQSEASGEFSSVSTAGSGRGAIWEAALGYWVHGGARTLIFGGGLRSVERIEQRSLAVGESVTAQSDFVAVLVELGIVGLVAWLLVWLALIRAPINWLILLPLATYALVNGGLEYVGAVVFGIALAAGCGPVTSVSASRTEAGKRAPWYSPRDPVDSVA